MYTTPKKPLQLFTETFKEGDTATKLSYFIMGAANLKNKQITKGLLFLISEILFIISFIYQVIPSIKGLITLGTKSQGMTTKTIDGIKIHNGKSIRK